MEVMGAMVAVVDVGEAEVSVFLIHWGRLFPLDFPCV